MVEQRPIDYKALPASNSSSAANLTTLGLTLLMPALFGLFVLLRWHQLSLADPYNNPYTSWATACLIALPAVAMADVTAMVLWRGRIALPVFVIALVILLAVAVYSAWFLVGMIRCLLP